ncbi:MAG: InlB B-repeat-containing protein, partial [Treponema sp.]|nr:InlB B-repeat-containing protein [Treponema sp.]
MCQKTWFFKGLLGVSLAFGLLLLSGCDLFNNKTYTVSFSPGEGGGTAPDTKSVEAGAVIILPDQGGMSPPAGKKTFGGWKTGNDTYQAGAGFTVNGNVVFTAVWNSGTGDGLYAGFYNYPTGRANPTGLLEITNSIAKQTLLFNGTVEAANYIGTVDSLSSVKVKLPDEKFYTIVAVDKENYEERQTQAAQFNVLTYYSNTQPYSIRVSPSNTYGGGTWVFNNKTSFWVQIKKTDMSQNY